MLSAHNWPKPWQFYTSMLVVLVTFSCLTWGLRLRTSYVHGLTPDHCHTHILSFLKTPAKVYLISFLYDFLLCSFCHVVNRAPTEPGNMTLQKGRIFIWSHVCTLPPAQEKAHAWQRQSRSGAEKGFVLFENGSNSNRECGLMGRHSPEREQRQIPGLV